jgi:hypothetical protein
VKLRTQFFASFFYHFLVSRTTVWTSSTSRKTAYLISEQFKYFVRFFFLYFLIQAPIHFVRDSLFIHFSLCHVVIINFHTPMKTSLKYSFHLFNTKKDQTSFIFTVYHPLAALVNPSLQKDSSTTDLETLALADGSTCLESSSPDLVWCLPWINCLPSLPPMTTCEADAYMQHTLQESCNQVNCSN